MKLYSDVSNVTVASEQGSMRRTGRPTAGRTTSTCLLPSVAAAPGPSWRTTSQRSAASGTPSASCAGWVFLLVGRLVQIMGVGGAIALIKLVATNES